MFGPTRSGATSELDALVKAVSAATVKFSNDKILKASGYLRDALELHKRGEKATQDDFAKIFASLETVKNDKSSAAYSQHMEAIGAMIPAFAANILPKDASAKEHFAACQDSVQYYLNRILKTAKETGDENNADWANAMAALLTGVATGSGRGAAGTEGATAAPASTAAAAVEEPARIGKEEPVCGNGGPLAVLEGNRWYVRKATNVPEPTLITPESLNQALAIEDSTRLAIKVDGKINAILADKCKQLDLEVGDVVSSIELLGCTKVRLFLTGEARIVVIDGCEAVQVYLSAASRDAKIVTSKCTEINVVVPAGLLDSALTGEDAEESAELPVPVQFFSCIRDGKLVTAPHEHVGV